jgi:hypothetical protein
MRLYRGSDVEVVQPRIITSDIGRDFGFGFCSEESLEYLEFIKTEEV